MGTYIFNIVTAQSGLKQFLRVRHLVVKYIQHLNKKKTCHSSVGQCVLSNVWYDMAYL